MTVNDVTLDAAVAQAAAAAAAALLPIAGPVLRPVAEPGAAAVLPGPTPVTVAVRLSGEPAGTVALVVAPAVADTLLQSPVGGGDAVAALAPALQAAVEALGAGLGIAVRTEACRALDPTVAADLPTAASAPVAVAVHDAAERHLATLLVVLEAGETIPSQRPAEPEFEPVAGVTPPAVVHRLDLLRDVSMAVTVQLGATRMTVRELLALTPGSILELDRAAGSPVDVLVNGTLIARGEVVVVDEQYAVRVTEIAGPDAAAGERPA